MDSPKPPDPAATAAAATASNKETANYQSSLNSVDQYTPYGNLTYAQNGTWSNGAPHMSATQTLTPDQQELYNTGLSSQKGLANIGQAEIGKVGDILATPFDLNAASNDMYSDIARQRLDPMWEQRAQQNETDLINRGIRPGSEGYDTMMGQFNQNRNDAYNQMYLQGKQMFDTEATAQRNQPLNEISALMSGSQVQNPNFVSPPQTGVQGTDVAGITQNAYQQRAQQSNASMGGLFGLGGSLVSGMFGLSDRRLKHKIERIGEYANGVPKYRYAYIWEAIPRHVGAMADEVEKVLPDAVFDACGFKAVNYRKLEAA